MGLIDFLQAKIFIFAVIAKMGGNDHIQAKILIFATIAKTGLIDHNIVYTGQNIHFCSNCSNGS
jgi:hypothetical protein